MATTKVEVIADICKNFVSTEHEEPLDVLLERAKCLIDAAKASEADVAKFQVHNVDDEIHPTAHFTSPHFNHDRYAWVKRNTYPTEFWFAIKEHCREVDIEFLATPMSRGAAILLDEVGVDRWKVGSGDILDFVLLDYIRDSRKHVILSSGMSTIEELRKAYNYLKEKTPDVSILHCVSQYPCPLDSLNLATISYLKREFPDATIGFSSHCIDIRGALAACGLGAEIIEQHLTLDRDAFGPDHKVSLLPDEMTELVQRIREGGLIEPTRDALGVETKFLQDVEAQFRPIFRKGLYTAHDITKDEIIEPSTLYAMRPCKDALPSEEYPFVVGQRAGKDYKQYEGII